MSVVIPDPLFGILSQACNYVWDINLLDWVPMEQPIIEGGTIVVGSVDQGTGGLSPWLITGSVTTGGLTDMQLRATPVPVSGTVTATGSGNFTVVQPTGTNLHTVIDSGTTTVTQGMGTNLHTVVDSGSINVGTVTTLPSITGTVTANAGTNLNTSLLALESGGNLATIATNSALAATAAKQDTGNTTLAEIATDTDSLITAQGAAGSSVTGPLVQGLVGDGTSAYLPGVIEPFPLTTSGAVRVSATIEPGSPWDGLTSPVWITTPFLKSTSPYA